MTNKQRYQRAFSVLHASESDLMEVKDMKRTKKISVSRLAAACAAVVMAIGLTSVAYAADVGGIQRTVQIWLNGEQTTAVLDIQGTSYTVTAGEVSISGGGVAIDGNGNERPLTEEEIMEQLNSPEVEYRDGGTVWVCYRGEETEITDRFDEDGICYVQIKTDEGTLYLTVKYNNGFASSSHSYISPNSFNN